MKVGIVGGSIAGCSAAILLAREGLDVSVYERSGKVLVGRGGGIGTIPSLIDEIKKEGLIGSDFASLPITKLSFVGKSVAAEPFGKRAGAIDMHFEVFQWNELWKHLRDHVPDRIYNSGVRVTGARMNDAGEAVLSFDVLPEKSFDLVLFADGYNSLGRSILFPDKQLKYRGFVLMRGLLPEEKIGREVPLTDEILRLSFKGKPGHNVVYYIPNENGSKIPGTRIYNWAAYIAIPEDELTKVMTDRAGRLRTGTLPPGAMHNQVEIKLKNFLSKHTPDFYADIVTKTKNSYIQVIYTLDLDKYYKDKMCLIGDAGIVVQPFTGSGVFKGYSNVKELISCLKQYSTTEEALRQWNEKQLQTGKRLLTLGEQMEKAFIWEQPDFATIDEIALLDWWNKSITFPKDFNYQNG